MMAMDTGFEVPSIVVLGEQSSGKSSLLESLFRVSLPRGRRVPLIVSTKSLKDDSESEEMYLEYHQNKIHITESNVARAIQKATNELAGEGRLVTNTPLTLVVKKQGIPDLTLVDLPAMIQIPADAYNNDMLVSIEDMVKEYITPKKTIIINVLSVESDFSTCRSISLARKADPTGERTLSIITRADCNPSKLFEMVTAPPSKNINIRIGLGFVCVRNRIGHETFSEALQAEEELFNSDPLSNIDKTSVGIPMLEQRLVQIQSSMLSKCLPSLQSNTEKLLSNLEAEVEVELYKLPRFNDREVVAFIRILKSTQSSLKQILVIGDYSAFPHNQKMHALSRLRDMLESCFKELRTHHSNPTEHFLEEEISVLKGSPDLSFVDFHSPSVFLSLLTSKVESISSILFWLVDTVWSYINEVVLNVLSNHCASFPQLKNPTTMAFEFLIGKMKKSSQALMTKMLSMEKHSDYTCSPRFLEEYNELMCLQSAFINMAVGASVFELGRYGSVNVDNVRADSVAVLAQAFELRVKMISYWNIVLCRLQDYIGLHICFAIRSLLFEELEAYLDDDTIMKMEYAGVEKVCQESPFPVGRREKLEKAIIM